MFTTVHRVIDLFYKILVVSMIFFRTVTFFIRLSKQKRFERTTERYTSFFKKEMGGDWRKALLE